MRRTLAVVLTTAALLVPATAASAASTSNASCNSGKTPAPAGGTWNGHGGNQAGTCGSTQDVASNDFG